MWPKWFPIIAAAVASALMYLSTVLGSMGAILLAFMASLPLFAIALSQGWSAGLTATVAGGALVVLLADGPAALVFMVFCGLPAVVLSRQATMSRPKHTDPHNKELEWYPAGGLVMTLTAIPVAGLLAGTTAAWLSGNGLEALVREQVEIIFDAMSSAMQGPFVLPQEQMDMAQELLISVLPGMAALQWAMLILVNALLAQAVLVRFSANMRPSPNMSDIKLPRWATLPLAIAALLAMLVDGEFGYLGRNALPVLCLPFFLSGLGLVHSIAGSLSGMRWLVPATYTLMVLSFVPHLAPVLQLVWVLVVFVGLVDQWMDFKSRIERNKNSS